MQRRSPDCEQRWGVGRLLVIEKRDLVDEWGDIDDPDITCTRWEKPAWLE